MATVKEGQLEPMALLFERHHLRLFHFFLGLTGHHNRSEDLVQEVFLRILKYRHSYKPGSAFAPWMFTIARRLHLDHATLHAPETPLEDWHESPTNHEDGAHHSLEQQSDRHLLARALARLAPHTRQLLLLSRDTELSYRDLANIFGSTEGAVKVKVHRALKELRSAFQELQGGVH